MSQIKRIAQILPTNISLAQIQTPAELYQENFSAHPKSTNSVQYTTNLGANESHEEFSQLEIVFSHLKGFRASTASPVSLLKRKIKFAEALLKSNYSLFKEEPLEKGQGQEHEHEQQNEQVQEQQQHSIFDFDGQQHDTHAFIHHLQSQPFYDSQIVHIEDIPPREAEWSDLKVSVYNSFGLV